MTDFENLDTEYFRRRFNKYDGKLEVKTEPSPPKVLNEDAAPIAPEPTPAPVPAATPSPAPAATPSPAPAPNAPATTPVAPVSAEPPAAPRLDPQPHFSGLYKTLNRLNARIDNLELSASNKKQESAPKIKKKKKFGFKDSHLFDMI